MSSTVGRSWLADQIQFPAGWLGQFRGLSWGSLVHSVAPPGSGMALPPVVIGLRLLSLASLLRGPVCVRLVQETTLPVVRLNSQDGLVVHDHPTSPCCRRRCSACHQGSC